MDNLLLFITGVLSGLIAGFLLTRAFGRNKIKSDGSTEGVLQDRLFKADQGLEKFGRELEAQKLELKHKQQEVQEAIEKAAISSTQLKAANEEKEELKISLQKTLTSLESLRREKESLSRQVGEVAGGGKSRERSSAGALRPPGGGP